MSIYITAQCDECGDSDAYGDSKIDVQRWRDRGWSINKSTRSAVCPECIDGSFDEVMHP